ncbi:MAG TPA: helix-turn-helix transcriptional regulator [Dysgonamonadaceae bacterium]|nr:helix-turn-helix transcriptional regulator [Dysgonamonadaceae bacterium]
MKKNAILESIRQKTPAYVKREIDLSFYVVNKIAEILQLKGMTQKDLANLLGKKESEISRWMTGTHNFTLRSIAKIEKALNVSIFDINKDEYSVNKFLKTKTNEFVILKFDESQDRDFPTIRGSLTLSQL